MCTYVGVGVDIGMRPERDHKREEEVLRKKDNRVHDLKVERGYRGLNRRRAGWGCSRMMAERQEDGPALQTKLSLKQHNETYHSVR